MPPAPASPHGRALPILGSVLAGLTAALLAGGVLAVPLRFILPPRGYDQPRLHWNTKNTTRFAAADLAGIADLIALAVYPSTGPATRPEAVLLYDPGDWRPALQAASLLRAANALLYPAVDGAGDAVRRLRPRGSPALGGAQAVLIDSASVPLEGLAVRSLAGADIAAVRAKIEPAPRHAVVVDAEDPETALLAATWAAFSGDLVVFDANDVPRDLPQFALGEARAGPDAVRIGEGTPEKTAVAFAGFDDPRFPSFGWGMNASSLTGYRAYVLARKNDPAAAVLAANLAVRGKPGPLLWTGRRTLSQVVNDYLFSQRSAFWETPSEGPFHHVFVLGDLSRVTFPAQGQADDALEIGPYLGKGAGMSGIDMVAAAWVLLGLAGAVWVFAHEIRLLPMQSWVMRLAWPLMALLSGPFGPWLYRLSYDRPVLVRGDRILWSRPLWLRSLSATVSAVGFGAPLMIATGFLMSFAGLPLLPMRGPFFFLGTPMVILMIVSYLAAVIVSWLVFQAPLLAMFRGRAYPRALGPALPLVLLSMTAAAAAMNPAMWWLMMSHLPMMPSEESILWFGVMFVSGFLALLLAWPFNHLLVRRSLKGGLM